ncbi:MAG: hypothetical protein KDA24_24465 [Deltaproteobacteria bacterium]|nr:hypothetical protein [Deltaproteobacteria bacterium]
MRCNTSLLATLPLALLLGCPAEGLIVVGDELPGALLSVRGAAEDDVWMCGADGGDGPALLHWDGSAWERFDTSGFAGVDLWWLHVGGTRVTAVGTGGTIVALDRTSGDITDLGGPGGDGIFFGVWGPSEDDLWAVGGDPAGASMPLLWRDTGSGWADALGGLGEVGQTYFKVHGSGSEAVIVGSGGLTLRNEGSGFALLDSPVSDSLLTVDVGAEQTVAVGGAGNGLALHLEDGAWVDRSPEFQPAINGVCSGGGGLRAVGARDTLHTWADGAWTSPEPGELPTNLALDYHACWIGPGGTFWGVGGDLIRLERGFVVREGRGSVADLSSP